MFFLEELGNWKLGRRVEQRTLIRISAGNVHCLQRWKVDLGLHLLFLNWAIEVRIAVGLELKARVDRVEMRCCNLFRVPRLLEVSRLALAVYLRDYAQQVI